MMIQKYIDNTFLKPIEEEEFLCRAKDTFKEGYRAICIDEDKISLVLKVKEMFPSSPTKVCIVRNFPEGSSINITDIAIAEELDIVLPLSEIKNKNWNNVNKFLSNSYLFGKTVKWILEEPLWNDRELVEIMKHIGNHYAYNGFINKVYIKSNTGFIARREDRPIETVIRTFPSLVKKYCPSTFGVKISGFVSTLEQVNNIINQGAIIGTSKGNQLVLDWEGRRTNYSGKLIDGNKNKKPKV